MSDQEIIKCSNCKKKHFNSKKTSSSTWSSSSTDTPNPSASVELLGP